MKKIILSAIICVASLGAYAAGTAQTETQSTQAAVSSVSGKVIDKETKEGLAGVAVEANGQKVYTDFDGNFTISNLCGSNCEVNVSMISYETQTIAVNPSNSKTLDVSLRQR